MTDSSLRQQGLVSRYAYRVAWSAEDNEYVATVGEFPSLSWLDASQLGALQGLQTLLAETIDDMKREGEAVPDPSQRR